MKSLKYEELFAVTGASKMPSCVPNIILESSESYGPTDCFTAGVQGHAHKAYLDGGSKNGPGYYWCNEFFMGRLSKETAVVCPTGESIHVQCDKSQDNHCRGRAA